MLAAMSPEKAQALVSENEALRAEVAALRQQFAEVTQQLQAALVRIAGLEQGKLEPPAFVKPNRPPPREAESAAPRNVPSSTTRRVSGHSRRALNVTGWSYARIAGIGCGARVWLTAAK